MSVRISKESQSINNIIRERKLSERLKYDFYKDNLYVFELNEERAKELFQEWIKNQTRIDSGNINFFMRNTTGGLLILNAKYKKQEQKKEQCK